MGTRFPPRSTDNLAISEVTLDQLTVDYRTRSRVGHEPCSKDRRLAPLMVPVRRIVCHNCNPAILIRDVRGPICSDALGYGCYHR